MNYRIPRISAQAAIGLDVYLQYDGRMLRNVFTTELQGLIAQGQDTTIMRAASSMAQVPYLQLANNMRRSWREFNVSMEQLPLLHSAEADKIGKRFTMAVDELINDDIRASVLNHLQSYARVGQHCYDRIVAARQPGPYTTKRIQSHKAYRDISTTLFGTPRSFCDFQAGTDALRIYNSLFFGHLTALAHEICSDEDEPAEVERTIDEQCNLTCSLVRKLRAHREAHADFMFRKESDDVLHVIDEAVTFNPHATVQGH